MPADQSDQADDQVDEDGEEEAVDEHLAEHGGDVDAVELLDRDGAGLVHVQASQVTRKVEVEILSFVVVKRDGSEENA